MTVWEFSAPVKIILEFFAAPYEVSNTLIYGTIFALFKVLMPILQKIGLQQIPRTLKQRSQGTSALNKKVQRFL